MTFRNRFGTAAASAILLTAIGACLPAPALAQHRGGSRRGPTVVVGRGFGFGPRFGYGLGFGSYLGPYGYGPYAYGLYPYGPAGGVDLNVAMMAGYGGVEMNVKPGQAEVWVDGKFIAEAKELDGYPSYLWLKEGVHKIVVYKGGYHRFEEEIEVQRGFKKDLRVRLEKGESDAPGRRPAGQI
jgi:PEGA domain